MDARQHTLDLLQRMIGPNRNFRPGQWEAIKAIAIQRKRVLVVQRTGWGKSLVYFLATRLLLQKGGLPFPFPFPEHYSKLPTWLEEHARQNSRPKPHQLGLF